MKKVLLGILVALGLACVTQYNYCDPDSGRCYVCDGVGCSPVTVGVPVRDSGVATEVSSCFSNYVCSPGSVCVGGGCRLGCTSFVGCRQVDVAFRSCTNGYCSTVSP